MNGLMRWLDPLFGVALAAALSMVVLTAWPGSAQAADRVVGSGESVTEQRSVGEFDALQTSSIKVLVRQGATSSVSVQADRNLLPLLETVVEDGAQGKVLKLRWKRWSDIKTKVEPVVTVVVVRLQALTVSGSGDIVAEPLQQPRLLVRVEGSGDVKLNGLVADELKVEIKGSGDVKASGRASRLSVSIAGSGDVQTADLKADDVVVNIAGSGDASVFADKTLAVSIAGSGDVVYSGNAVVKKSVAGSGSVTRR